MMQASGVSARFRRFLIWSRRLLIVLAPLFLLDAMADSVLAKKATKKATFLPELAGQQSQAFDLGHLTPSNSLVIAGTSADAQGVARAVLWERSNMQWMIMPLPPLSPGGAARAMAVPPDPVLGDPTRYAAGAAADVGGPMRPVLWHRADDQSPWMITPLPGLDKGVGEVRDIAIPPDPVAPPPDMVGWSADDAGFSKAAVWQFDMKLGWMVMQLADLGTPDPDKASRANSFAYDALGRLVVAGMAENDSLQPRPVVWRDDGRRAFGKPMELSLCDACVAGEVTGVAPDEYGSWFWVGWGDPDAGGPRLGVLWHTQDDGQTYIREDLGVPMGFVNSEAHAALGNEEALVVGHADDDAPGTAQATLWTVNHTTMKVTDEPLSASVANLPPNVMLRQAAAMDGHQNVVGSFDVMPPAEGDGGRAGVGGSGPHAYVLTPCGDYDGDGDVDLDDFGAFAACYNGANNPPAPACPPGVDADCDADGDVDLDDFSFFAGNYTGAQ